MEKPRKQSIEYYEECKCIELYQQNGWNSCHDAMSTWIEGAVPSIEEIEEVIKTTWFSKGIEKKVSEGLLKTSVNNLAINIHTLLTQRLGGDKH